MRPQPTPYDEKLNSILATAARIFAEKGYHKASIRDISRATGVSLSGLYYYFQSKEELLYLIQDHAFCTLASELEERLGREPDPEKKIRMMIAIHLTYFFDNMSEMKVLSHEAESLSGEYLERVTKQKRRLVGIVSAVLAELRPESDLDPRVATFALFGMMNWLYNWYRPGRDVDLPRLIDDITRIFLTGFLDPEPPAAGASLFAASALQAGGSG